MFALAGIHALIPFAQSYIQLVAAFIVSGACGGFVNSAGNIHLIDLWGKENPPFFQALHFTFGLGALIAPLIVRPFLLDLGDIDDYEEDSLVLGSKFNETFTNNTLFMEHKSFGPDDVQLKYPYWIISLIIAVPAVLYLLLWRLHPKSNPHPSRLQVAAIDAVYDHEDFKNPEHGSQDLSVDSKDSNYGSRDSVVEGIDSKADKKQEAEKERLEQIARIQATPSYKISKYTAIALMMTFMPIYNGIELTFGQYLASFAVKSDLHLQKVTGASMTSLYWAMFTFFRLSTVFYINILGSEKNIIMNVGIMLIANAILVPFGSQYEWCLWLGSVIMGIGCSSIWGSAFGYLEDYFPINSKIGSLIVVSTCVGEFIFPVLISQFIKEYPNIFLLVTLICSVSLAIIFAVVVLICKLKLKIRLSNENSS